MPLPPDFKPSDFSIGSLSDRQLVNLAKLAGVMVEGEALTAELQEFTLLIMEKCADVGDKYQSRKHGRTAGDEIRALFGIY
ncbi:MAG: hypothetical protein ABI893_05135 [Polaromonas sp.]|uniref:hypothetical protein n=1 Tax=Polaromonas sp. TaxID=1869339 RepID=UPI0032632FCC